MAGLLLFSIELDRFLYCYHAGFYCVLHDFVALSYCHLFLSPSSLFRFDLKTEIIP